MNILQNYNWIIQNHNLIKNKDFNIESRPTTLKANKPQATNLQ